MRWSLLFPGNFDQKQIKLKVTLHNYDVFRILERYGFLNEYDKTPNICMFLLSHQHPPTYHAWSWLSASCPVLTIVHISKHKKLPKKNVVKFSLEQHQKILFTRNRFLNRIFFICAALLDDPVQYVLGKYYTEILDKNFQSFKTIPITKILRNNYHDCDEGFCGSHEECTRESVTVAQLITYFKNGYPVKT